MSLLRRLAHELAVLAFAGLVCVGVGAVVHIALRLIAWGWGIVP